jgi:hypothetical protein
VPSTIRPFVTITSNRGARGSGARQADVTPTIAAAEIAAHAETVDDTRMTKC